MTAAEYRAVLHRAGEHWNGGNLAGYLELYAPEAVMHGIPGVEPGREHLRQYYEAFWAAFPDSRLHFEDIVAEGDRLAVRFVFEAIHRGPFQGIPPTDKPVRLPGITILRFANGRCVERWSQADLLGLLQQLDAIPAPGA
jgi:predicted ester cyclase